MFEKDDQWFNAYTSLDLCGGKLKTISDDDEDMLTITYPNGLVIDVGYISEENSYYITVVKDNSSNGWNSPIMQINVLKKSSLLDALQNTIQKIQGFIF